MSKAAERWQLIEEILDAALDIPVADRAAFLSSACAGDADVREHVARLLQACDESEWFLATPVDRFVAPLVAAIAGEARDDWPPGTVISHYEVISRAAAGGMGVVYQARDVHLDRLVALKFLPMRLTADDTARARLVAEARAVAALDHPNVAVVHEIGETEEGRQFIAMAWYEGVTLREALADGPLAVADAVRIAAQIASALSAAHGAGVVHRDIKPSNILLTAERTAKLVDFGIAKTVGAELTREGTTVGTVAYMSPEQTRGFPVDHRTDLWSLGVVLYEMLSGQRPFRGESDETLIYAIRNDEPVPLVELRPDAAPELGLIVTSCLTKSAEERCASARELLERLLVLDIHPFDDDEAARLSDHLGKGARRVGATRRRHGLQAAVAVGTIALLAAGAWFTSGNRFASAVLDDRRVVVAPLENRTGQPALDMVGHMAADWIVQGLADTRLVDIVPVSSAFAVALAVTDSVPDADERIARLARRTGAGIVVSGAYYRQGDSLYLRAVITDAVRHRILHAVEPSSTVSTAPIAGIEQLRARVMSALAPALFPQYDYSALVSRPPSFEAYSAFMRGVHLFIEREYARAIPLFLEASARDSTFMLPLIHAGAGYSLMGNHPALDTLLGTIRPRVDRLSEVERLGFDMLEARVAGDLEGFYQLSRRAPAAWQGTALPWRIANAAMWVNRPRELIETMRQLDPERGDLRGWRLDWVALGQAHHLLGQHRQELRVARRSREVFPGDTFPIRGEVHALAALRRTRELRELLAQHTAGPRSPPHLLRVAGLELRAHGAPRDGDALLRQSLDWQLAHPAEGLPARLFLAESHLLVGEIDEAERIVRELDRRQPGSIEVIGVLGVIAARRGDRARAMEMSDWLGSLDLRYYRARTSFRRARIAAQLGDHAEAVQFLNQAYKEGMIFWPDLHYDADLAPLHEFAPFQDFIRPKG